MKTSLFVSVVRRRGADAPDYCVDVDNGNDTTGTGTLAAPWKTLVKAETVAGANKTIGVKGNGVGYETAAVAMKAGQIIFAMRGYSPIISRAILRSGFTLTAGRTITYEISTTDTINTVWQDVGTKLTSRASVALVEANAGSWYSDGSKLYVSCSDSADPSTHTIETVRNAPGSAVVQFGGNGCELRGLRIRHAPDIGIYAAATTSGVVRNCAIEYCQTFNGYGIKQDAGGVLSTYGVTINACLYNVKHTSATWSSHSDTVSYGVTGAWDVTTPVSISLENFTAHHNTGDGVPDYSAISVSGSLSVYNNTAVGAYIYSSLASLLAHDNTGIAARIMAGASGVVIRNALIYNQVSGISNLGTNTQIIDAECYSNSGSSIASSGSGCKIIRAHVYNCTTTGANIDVSGADSVVELCRVHDCTGNAIKTYNAANVRQRLNVVYSMTGAYSGFLGNGSDGLSEFNFTFSNENGGLELLGDAPSGFESRYNLSLYNESGLFSKLQTSAFVHHNVFINFNSDGLADKGGNGDRLEDNIIIGVSSMRGIGLRVEGATNCQNVSLLRNLIRGMAQRGLWVDTGQSTDFSSDYNYLIGNVLTGRWLSTDCTTIADWRTASGQDAHSVTSGAPADTVYIGAAENDIGARKGAALIVNLSEANTVSIDLSSLGLTVGASYKAINALRPDIEESQAFTYSGVALILDISSWSVIGTHANPCYPTVGACWIDAA